MTGPAVKMSNADKVKVKTSPMPNPGMRKRVPRNQRFWDRVCRAIASNASRERRRGEHEDGQAEEPVERVQRAVHVGHEACDATSAPFGPSNVMVATTSPVAWLPTPLILTGR